MVILRLLLVLAALAVAIAAGLYFFTGNRRYLNLAWQIVRFVVFVFLIFAVLFVLERYALSGWRILFR